MNQRGRRAALLDGLLQCRGCGGKTYAARHRARGQEVGQYVCAGRTRGISACSEPSAAISLADEAVLAQVVRLRGAPWRPQPCHEEELVDANEAQRRRLQAELAAAERQLQQNAAAYASLGDFSSEAAEAFRANARPISERIRGLKEQLAALPPRYVDTIKAEELHALLRERDLAGVIAVARERGDAAVLREILERTVREARIVARGSTSGAGRSSRWVRAAVEWTAEVEHLLRRGDLVLGEELAEPARKSERELAAERARRYRARKRAQFERSASQ